MRISVREMKQKDIEFIVDYFVNADADFLNGMGADKSKLTSRIEWIKKLRLEFQKPIAEKELYYCIWEIDGEESGHSNINNIDFGHSATMHLHLWESYKRRNGLGLEFLAKTIPFFFMNFELEKLICEPYALNPAPNRILKKIGFEFIKSYETSPGAINFRQKVNRYEMTSARFNLLQKDWH